MAPDNLMNTTRQPAWPRFPVRAGQESRAAFQNGRDAGHTVGSLGREHFPLLCSEPRASARAIFPVSMPVWGSKNRPMKTITALIGSLRLKGNECSRRLKPAAQVALKLARRGARRALHRLPEPVRSARGSRRASLTGSLAALVFVGACTMTFASQGARAQTAGATKAPRRLPPGINEETARAIDRGLAYLKRAQDRQGSWSNRGGYGEYPVAMTALAGLALLMDGNTTTQGRYAPEVDRAARYLLRQTTPSGLLARTENDPRPMYGHGFSMLFLSQLYGMTEDVDRARTIHDALVRAIDLTARAQSRDGGWIYTPTGGGDEGSVTVTQVQALRSCRNVGLAVPKGVIDSALQYLVNSQNSDGGIRYALRQRSGSSRIPITAAAVCCWFNAGAYTDAHALKALAFCKEQMRPRVALRGHDYYGHLYFAQALYVSSDPYWNKYFPQRRDFILSQQLPDGSWFGDGVGDVYGTAIALVILQLPYNQLPIMQQ